ncbi:unnamed protein product [Chondrus crispus]|uniref:RING-type domain-containing protein n=1 Tax=Chondrus crispus TaxID=2769 RepID=R7QDB3_CHOCR|nr:unnamed protein product [Chondrus crispus]CDF36477.1 unnamed protein product [Chondrus crispus]|eukprot:XP_005716296.1 unnamed protein product [Chondrus crispus]
MAPNQPRRRNDNSSASANAPSNPTHPPSSRPPATSASRPRRAPNRRAAAHKPAVTGTTAQPAVEEPAGSVCTICANVARDWAVGNCPHVVCGDCSHRMRVLYDRKACVMCQVDLRQVVVVPVRVYHEGMSFDDAVALPGAFQDKPVQMWFIERTRHQQLKNFRGWKCSHKHCNAKGGQESVFANATQLRAHAKTEHNALYCETCFSGKKNFVSEIQLYPLDAHKKFSSRLKDHLRKNHPQCRFCRRYYLDDEKLYAHLQEQHEACRMCERNGRMHEYYLNFQELEKHYRKEHYTCPHEGCRGEVFATHIELQAHEHTRHSDNTRGARPRALTVNLQQLHGERDPRRRRADTPQDLRREQTRQAARRRAFLSSNVVFSGALNFGDSPVPAPIEETQSTAASRSGPGSRPSASSARSSTNARSAPVQVRRPDDGHFHELDQPQDEEEREARKLLLTKTMRSLVDPAAYEQFRLSSGQFQSGQISAEAYFEAATDAFGVRSAVRDILPELVALLPELVLREPLRQVCYRKTDTKLSYSGNSAGPSDAANAATGEDEQFPSLTGAPVPRAAPKPVRRFGMPGPEAFPRLGRVNKPQGNASSSSSTQAARPVDIIPTRQSAPQTMRQPAQPANAKTAVSVLLKAPPSHARIGQQQGISAVRGANNAPGPHFSSGSFPALGPVGNSAPASASGRANRVADGAGSSSSNAPNPDVAMRVGAVWGGVSANAHNGGGKKRGPGKGNGRRPASPPKRTILTTNDIPDIRASGGAGNSSSAGDDADRQPSGTEPAVVDILQVAKARRSALQKSSLPKVGGSGYGFAWDRKRAQQKRKQIKDDANQSSGG